MAEEQAAKKFELSEVMLAMDVVDTLRHQQSLVQRELQTDDREADLIDKLRKIYADQGLEVTDAVISQGVKALREERFTYQPPPAGLQTTLARLYVNRGRWAKGAVLLLLVLAAGWAGYRYLYVMPAERGRSRLVQELKNLASGQQEKINTLQAQISTITGELDKTMSSLPSSFQTTARRLADQARQSLTSAARELGAAQKLGGVMPSDPQILDARAASIQQRLAEQKGIVDRAQGELQNAQAAIQSIRSLENASRDLDLLRAEAFKAAREPGAADKIEALYNSALSAIRAGDLETARTARQALQITRDMLGQEYTLQIVSRPGTQSGVWRYPADSRTARNYYLIVEAVTPSGQRLELPITSEEDGKVRSVSEWGLRVDPNVYERVRQDKMDDGIVNNKTVGSKKRGYLTPDYTVITTGGAITEW